MAEVCNGASDFLLFPPDPSYLETLDLPSDDDFNNLLLQHSRGIANEMHRHRDFSSHAGTSYEALPPALAYSSTTFFEGPDSSLSALKRTTEQSVQRHTSSGSPSPSNSQSFDHRSSTLSSASGASAQSTASSTDGSPYANARHGLSYPEKWPEPLHGLGIGPEIVNSEDFSHDSFPSANFENDLMLEGSKFSSYVGEYRNNFSSSLSQSFPTIPSVSSASPSPPFESAFSSPPLAPNAAACARDVTIDSILEEANSKVRNPGHLVSPVSATSATASPTSHVERDRKALSAEGRPSFLSPGTPASAASHFPSPTGSPLDFGGSISPKQKRIESDSARVQSSSQQSPHRFHPYCRATPDLPSHDQCLFEKSSNPFFGQSSGRFIAPLELSCWFSLHLPSRAQV